MKNNISQQILNLLDDDLSVFEVAKFFGGMEKFKQLIEPYEYLKKIVYDRLGVNIRMDDATSSDKIILIPFTVVDIESLDDESEAVNLIINIELPEVQNKHVMMLIYNYIDEYLGDVGEDGVELNDYSILGTSMFMPILTSINNINWRDLGDYETFANDKEFAIFIPKKYFH